MRILRKLWLVLGLLALVCAVLPPQPAQAVPTPSPIYPAPSASPFPQACVYNSPLPTLVNGQTATIACDVHGNILVNWVLNAPSPVPIQGVQYARTEVGSTITTGGVAQTWAAPGSIQHGCEIQNRSSGYLYLQFDGNAASTTSLQLRPNGGAYTCSQTGTTSTSASIFGTISGQAWAAEIW